MTGDTPVSRRQRRSRERRRAATRRYGAVVAVAGVLVGGTAVAASAAGLGPGQGLLPWNRSGHMQTVSSSWGARPTPSPTPTASTRSSVRTTPVGNGTPVVSLSASVEPSTAPSDTTPSSTPVTTTTSSAAGTTPTTVAASTPAASTPAATTSAAPGTTGTVAEQVLMLVNVERAAAGCAPVAADAPALTTAAQAHAEDMARNDYFSHTSLDGRTPFQRMTAAGYDYRVAGENIARGQSDAEEVMQAWMDSEGHRANILNCSFTDLGVGYVSGSGGPWWVQDFGG